MPLQRGQLIVQAVVGAVLAIGGSGLLLLCVAVLARWVLVRRRLATWEAEWRVTGPQWTSQR